MNIQPVYDTLKYLAITSSTLPCEAFWLTRVFYTRRHRHSQLSTPFTTPSHHLSPIYQLLVGFAIAQAGGTIIDVVCNRKVIWIADDSLYLVALACWMAVYFTAFNKLYESKIFQIVTIAGETISWTRSVIGGIDSARTVFPHSIFVIYLFAMIAGGAGGLIGQYEMRIWANSPNELNSLVYSPTGVHLSLCMGILYVGLSQTLALPDESIKVIICATLLVLSYLSHFGISVDPLAALLSTAKTQFGTVSVEAKRKTLKPKNH